MRLQIVVLNTNLMKRGEGDEESARQWDWLEKVLQKLKINGETVSVYIQSSCDISIVEVVPCFRLAHLSVRYQFHIFIEYKKL